MQFLRTESTNSRDLNIRYSHTGTTHSFLSWGGKKRRKKEREKKKRKSNVGKYAGHVSTI